MAIDTGASKSRRAVLAGAIGGAGALAISALGHPAAVAAAANGNVQLGHGVGDTDNDSSIETRVNATSVFITAFSAVSLGSGIGLKGMTVSGSGVHGSATSGTGVTGQSDSNAGVSGTSNTGNGVQGTGGVGVSGTGGVGVAGHSAAGFGVTGDTTTGTAVQATSYGAGRGLDASSATGTGARGASTDNTPSDFLNASNKTGIIGTAGDASGLAANTDEIGVLGYCDVSSHSTGVLGVSTAGVGSFGIGAIGVIGFGSWGVLGDVDTASIGVYGNTGAAAAPAVTGGIGVLARAQATTQVALKVLGKTQFSRSARTYVSAGTSSKKVSMAGVTTSSYVIATLQTNRAGVYVQAVVPGTGYFTIYLNKAVSATTYVGYLVIN